MYSPRNVFNEPILTSVKKQQKTNFKRANIQVPDGSLPTKASWQKIIAEDERQLDLLQGRRD